MADELFDGVTMAVGTQSAFGTINATTRDLGTTLGVADGIILGDKNSGDGESGITLPNLSAIVREVAQVTSSFTQSADAYLREAAEGLAITFPLQGNGADAGAPDADAAQPDAGIEAILGAAGLGGETGGASPDYKFIPSSSTEYVTIKVWVGDLSFVFQDCLVDTLAIALTPGAAALITANIKVGSIPAAPVNGIGALTLTYGTQASLASPVVEGMAFDVFGQTRGFEDLTITIANGIEEFGDSNVATTGIRQSQKDRVITVDGRIYSLLAQSDAEHLALVDTNAPTADLTMQLGNPDVGGAETALNAAKVSVNNLQPKDIKYDRTGTALVVELSGAKATSTSAGTEFELEYN